MCTRILKKESSSRALAFVFLLFMMPLGFIGNAQSCRATEDEPLLRGHASGQHVVIPINGDRGDLEEGGGSLNSALVHSDDPLPEIRVDPLLLTKVNPLNLPVINIEAVSLERLNPLDLPVINIDNASLEKPNPRLAQDEMNKIIHYLSYVSGDEELKLEVIAAAKSLGIYLDDAVQFQRRLYDRAMGAAGQGPLAMYLKDLRSKIIGLQKRVPELQGQNVQLRERIENLVLGIQDLQVVVPQLQEQNTQLTSEISSLLEKINTLQDIVPQLQERSRVLGESLERKKAELSSVKDQNEAVRTIQKTKISNLERKNFYLWIALPTMTVLTGVAAFFVSHYVWR